MKPTQKKMAKRANHRALGVPTGLSSRKHFFQGDKWLDDSHHVTKALFMIINHQ
jgi:hypothetical protein